MPWPTDRRPIGSRSVNFLATPDLLANTDLNLPPPPLDQVDALSSFWSSSFD
jgi:hypothetical protein